MQNHSLRRILGQPALHILVALGFVVAFAWPIFVFTQPRQIFYFLYAVWLAAIAASLALSRGQASEQTRDVTGSRAAAKRRARGQEEAR
jgi:hypothetical protein